MSEDDDRRRAVAKCEKCGDLGVVHVWSDGRYKPLGQSTFCDCDEPSIRELEDEPDAGNGIS